MTASNTSTLATLEAQAVPTPTLDAAAQQRHNEDREAIIDFGTFLSDYVVDKNISFNVAFNGFTVALTTLMLEYGLSEDGQSMDLRTIGSAFDHFVAGLKEAVTGAIDRIKADAEAVADTQAAIAAQSAAA